jgi:hypothetical protein
MIGCQLANERLVHLYAIDRHSQQVAKAGEPGAEVVMRKPDAAGAQFLDALFDDLVALAKIGIFGNFDHQLIKRHSEPSEYLLDLGR